MATRFLPLGATGFDSGIERSIPGESERAAFLVGLEVGAQWDGTGSVFTAARVRATGWCEQGETLAWRNAAGFVTELVLTASDADAVRTLTVEQFREWYEDRSGAQAAALAAPVRVVTRIPGVWVPETAEELAFERAAQQEHASRVALDHARARSVECGMQRRRARYQRDCVRRVVARRPRGLSQVRARRARPGGRRTHRASASPGRSSDSDPSPAPPLGGCDGRSVPEGVAAVGVLPLAAEELDEGWALFVCPEHGDLAATFAWATVTCRCGRRAVPWRLALRVTRPYAAKLRVDAEEREKASQEAA